MLLRNQVIQNQLKSCNKVFARNYYEKVNVSTKKKYPVIAPIEAKLPSVDGSEIFKLWKQKQIKRLDPIGWKTKAVSGGQKTSSDQYERYLADVDTYSSEENKSLPLGYSVYNDGNNDKSEFWKFYPHTKKDFFEKIQKSQLPIRNYPLPLRYGDIVKISFKSNESTEPDMFGVITEIKSALVDSSITIKMKYGDVESKVNVPLYTTDFNAIEIIDRKNDGNLEEIDMNELPDFIELSQQFKKFELKRRFDRMREYEEKLKQQKKD